MTRVEVKNQAEFDACIEAGNVAITVGFRAYVKGKSKAVVYDASVEAWDRSSVVALGESSVVAKDRSSVMAWDSVSVEVREHSSVEALGNSSVEARDLSSVEALGHSSVVARDLSWVKAREHSSVEARDSASVVAKDRASVVAHGNASVKARGHSSVLAWDYSSVEARDSASVDARGYAFVRVVNSAHSVKASETAFIARNNTEQEVDGGQVIDCPTPDTAEKWCEFYGVPIEQGVAVLFKAVNDEYMSTWGMSYKPGTKPKADDWDGGLRECGGGLHFSPTPKHAKRFDSSATRYIACPVKVSAIAVHPKGACPEKVKAEGVHGACFEVDLDGNPVKRKEDAI